MKDNFSSQSDNYAKYRPTYPQEFFDYLFNLVQDKETAWDCGTGNGQVATELAKAFRQVFATDISRSQIEHALQADNIIYSIQPAEKTNFEENKFDLIVVAQAIHWFDFEKFYDEVRKTAKENALICVLGYGRVEISQEIDELITDFYQHIIGKYWDKERRYVDELYQTIPFPFKEIQAPKFENKMQWSLHHLIGYLETWSAVKHFIAENSFNPVQNLKANIEKVWGDALTRDVRFPLLLRLGEIT